MKKYLFYLLGVALLLFACKNESDKCGPGAVANSLEEIYIYGKVYNYVTNTPEANVRLSFLDQIGGSFILKQDELTESNTDGCFVFENQRDVAEVNELIASTSNLTPDHLNQSIIAQDEAYLHLYTQQGSSRINGRHKYNSQEEVQIYVAPAAPMTFINSNGSTENYAVQWEFTDPTLSYSSGGLYAALTAQQTWKMPATTPVEITIFRSIASSSNELELIKRDTMTLNWEEAVTFTF
ncbi:MAG: hypothetical protein AAFO94_16710 [Bacteroidota bacterium]